MKTLLIAVCFAVALLTFGVSSAQDTTNHDDMKAEDSKNEVRVTGTISETGKTFVSTIDGKSWTIINQKTQWRSGRIALRPDGVFLTTIHADKGERNSFHLE